MNLIKTFQQRVVQWFLCCLGQESFEDAAERDYRLLEEVAELIQARRNLNEHDAMRVFHHVFARPVGEVTQEIAGVLTTLAVLTATVRTSNGHEVDMLELGELELLRIWKNMHLIREKQKTKVRALERPTKRLYADD